MKNLKKIFILLTIILLIFLYLPNLNQSSDSSTRQAQVTQIINQTDTIQQLTLTFDDGTTTSIENDESYSSFPRLFQQGDKVLVVQDQNGSYITDFIRTPQLTTLLVLFLLITLLVTGWQGLGSLLGLIFSFFIIFQVTLPLIIAGYSPVWVAIASSLIIIPSTFYPAHGLNKKTNIAIISTFLTLLVAGLLASIFTSTANITGLASEEVNFLSFETAQHINFQGLVLAGIIIGLLGILDDITISQASIVKQLKLSKKSISFTELFTRAMTVGRDHIASLVNTLVLVYAGASLPLLLLFVDQSQSFQSVINLEFIATEIIHTLVGSIALILAVPITTLIAAQFSDGQTSKTSHPHRH